MERDIIFGEFLRNMRKREGITQFQLGRLLGVSDRAVSKWENGLSKPKSKLLIKMSDLFGLSIDELLAANLNANEMIQIETAKNRYDISKKLDNILLDKYGHFPSVEVISRYEKEKRALANSNILQILYCISLLKALAQTSGNKIKVMGALGSSFIAFVLGVTSINPLPPHYYCPKCKFTEFISEAHNGWDLPKKRCKCCNTMLRRDGHNLSFEVYSHIINKKAGFDVIINKKFYDLVEQFIIDKLDIFSITILKNPDKLYHGKIAADATTFIIQPIVKKRCIKKLDYVPTVNEYFAAISGCPYVNVMFDDSFEKIVELENMINIPYERINLKDTLLLNNISHMDSRYSNFNKLLNKCTTKSFDGLIRLFGIAMLSEEYPCVLESVYSNLDSIEHYIVYRDDLFDLICAKLRSYGCYDFEIAYIIMNNARKGIYYRNGLAEETKKLLGSIGFSQDFFRFLESTQYMFSKAAGIIYFEEKLTLLWYKLNHPDKFIRVFGKE